MWLKPGVFTFNTPLLMDLFVSFENSWFGPFEPSLWTTEFSGAPLWPLHVTEYMLSSGNRPSALSGSMSLADLGLQAGTV